jgi:hypothetical protein
MLLKQLVKVQLGKRKITLLNLVSREVKVIHLESCQENLLMNSSDNFVSEI